ncbi:selenocysteine-specific translation elongation factor [Halarcobacter ebronensis]|uniref:Selenocysteine-specific translation elongation factor n=1 Tax=Halarcobacter ebronensis TaxID=1462615 RepID=A0A4Q1AJK0_9BACT|nr:selenocysteine-specific translation elongation factor [Halarcobacter ebronensis]QKF81786.1 selenocysteine-specific elongation factor [Halarcobacter ebronensis]RXK04540.1 selenocysteine-specific translation elongation factor [Halarcobacter ebronensis]
MANYIIGTCGHIDHGKTSLIKALNGFEGDSTNEEKQRGITIDLSFSNMKRDDKNIAFIDVPGHEKLVKNMIAGAFSFDCVMIVVSANERIKPQTVEHLEILNLLGVKNAVLTITKKDLIEESELEFAISEIEEFIKEFDFNLLFTSAVSIYDEKSINDLKDRLFALDASTKIEENFFRYYVDRIFSIQGAGTVVTGTVLGKPIKLEEKVFICDTKKEAKIKKLQVHGKEVEESNISNRTAINLAGIKKEEIQKGFVISKKGYLRGFSIIDISFNTLKNKSLKHNTNYSIFIGSKRVEGKVLLFNNLDSLESGFATLKLEEEIFSIYKEKLIIRQGNHTIAGAKILSPISDPLKKSQKLQLLQVLEEENINQAYKILLDAHKKGLGLISSAQRFALNHEKALEYAKELEDVFIDEQALIIYPIETKELIKDFIKEIYMKNQFAFLSNQSIALRLKWASQNFIQIALNELVKENFLVMDQALYKNPNITIDFKTSLETQILKRLENESITPTAPYNIYDEMDLDRKVGDDILKSLCNKKVVLRLQHNIFIHAQSLTNLVNEMKKIIKQDGYIDLQNLKDKYPISRKYLITYLDYLDNFSEIKKEEDKRVFIK